MQSYRLDLVPFWFFHDKNTNLSYGYHDIQTFSTLVFSKYDFRAATHNLFSLF